jgi:NAD(P)-dependent dehydrogenase (short-subunit alcohol dehydrogenase family)
MSGFSLAGRTALVTGASRGIGRAVALGFAEAGADVALVARDEAALVAVCAEIEGRGRKAVVLPCDVTDRAAVEHAVAAAIDGLGHLDVVVNNAGGTSFRAPFTRMRRVGWDKVLQLNLDSVVSVCAAVGPHLLERGSGSVINMASVAGLVGTPQLAPYGAAKAAVISLTRSLAMEWGKAGVRVNALCPGWTETDLNEGLRADAGSAHELVAESALARWAQPDEIVGPTLFLASDASSYVTGSVLVVDGGLTAGGR